MIEGESACQPVGWSQGIVLGAEAVDLSRGGGERAAQSVADGDRAQQRLRGGGGRRGFPKPKLVTGAWETQEVFKVNPRPAPH